MSAVGSGREARVGVGRSVSSSSSGVVGAVGAMSESSAVRRAAEGRIVGSVGAAVGTSVAGERVASVGTRVSSVLSSSVSSRRVVGSGHRARSASVVSLLSDAKVSSVVSWAVLDCRSTHRDHVGDLVGGSLSVGSLVRSGVLLVVGHCDEL